MRAVFLSYAYPPLAYPRAIQVSRLVKFLGGTEIDLYCGTGERGREDATLDQPALRPDLRVHRVAWLPDARAWRLLHRIAPWDRLVVPDSFRPWADRAGRRIAADPAIRAADVLCTFGQPMSCHVAGLALKRRLGTPWLAHFSDPWVDNPYGGLHGKAAERNRALEAAVIDNADLLVLTNEEAANLLLRRYPTAAEKIRTLPHAFDETLYTQVDARHRTDGTIVRVVGTFYGPRTPEPLAAALHALATTEPEALDRVRVELIGQVPAAMRELPALRALSPGLLSVREPVGYRESLALMHEADLLVVVDAPADVSVFLPSKLIDYVGAGRPILALTPPGPAARTVTALGGTVADPDDGPAAAQALRGALSIAKQRCTAPWGNAAERARFAAPAVAEAFRALMEEAVARWRLDPAKL